MWRVSITIYYYSVLLLLRFAVLRYVHKQEEKKPPNAEFKEDEQFALFTVSDRVEKSTVVWSLTTTPSQSDWFMLCCDAKNIY